jgi:hypothetical protein
MATAAQEALARDQLFCRRWQDDFNAREILACHEACITTTVPLHAASGDAAEGMYVKADVVFDVALDVYDCTAR